MYDKKTMEQITLNTRQKKIFHWQKPMNKNNKIKDVFEKYWCLKLDWIECKSWFAHMSPETQYTIVMLMWFKQAGNSTWNQVVAEWGRVVEYLCLCFFLNKSNNLNYILRKYLHSEKQTMSESRSASTSCTALTPPVEGARRQQQKRQTVLTADGEHVGLDLCSDLDATPPLGVVRATQARHVGYTALMDVHQTVWKNNACAH